MVRDLAEVTSILQIILRIKKELFLIKFKARPKKKLNAYVSTDNVYRVNGSVKDVMMVGVASCATRKYSH
jgi:hypothetical protein